MLCQNFAYILEKRADCYPNDIAITEAHNGQKYTYTELYRRANRTANALREMGIGKGDRLVCLTRNTIEYFDLFFAVARLGAIITPLNYRLANNELAGIVADAEPKLVVYDSFFKDKAEALHASGVKDFVVYGEDSGGNARQYRSLVQRQPDKGPEIAATGEDPFLMLFTAGSTGRPKGVPLSHRNIFFSATNRIVDMGITRQDHTLTMMPLFHIGGHILYTLPHLQVGARVTLYPQFEPEMILKLIQQEKITITYMAPTMFKIVMQVPGWEKYDLSSIRFIGAGGEPVPAVVIEAFSKGSFPVVPGYGLTESTNGTLFLRPEHCGKKAANCIGKPVTSTDARVVDAQGNDVPAGHEGELIHRGPTVASGYWRKPDDTAKTFRDGWLHTGDVVVKDEEGFFYFKGRTDDMIVSGAEHVFPAEVEDAISKHPKVANVAVLGVPHELWGQTVKAVIAPKAGMSITKDEIVDQVTKQLAAFKKPRIVEFVSELPKMGSGKLDRKQIKELYGKPPKK